LIAIILIASIICTVLAIGAVIPFVNTGGIPAISFHEIVQTAVAIYAFGFISFVGLILLYLACAIRTYAIAAW
jgi:hypothetical protein